MKKIYAFSVFLIFFFQYKISFASHAAGADLSYKCLGGNNYEVTFTFYRDCSGISAPSSATVKITAPSCGIVGSSAITLILNQSGPPVEITPVCPTAQTKCNGGPNPGIQKYTYKKIVTLPAKCLDWTFDYELCCRNSAIQTIQNPGSQNLHIKATLNNLTDSCNSSVTFANDPIPFVCTQSDYCFDHGTINPDGDSLVFTAITPLSNGNSTVTYTAGYSVGSPLNSNPAFPFTFDPSTGQICFNSLTQTITVIALEVKEYSNGILVGSVIRDMQIYTIPCNNLNPNSTGFDQNPISGSNTDTAICAGLPLTLSISASDPDGGDLVTIDWNNAIPGATWTVDYTDPYVPVATLTWTPTAADISNVPHCFSVTVYDDNCPYFGTFSQSYCITVSGLTVDIGPDIPNAPCNISHNTVPNLSGGVPPYIYAWSDGSSGPSTNFGCGTHALTVTDAAGCQGTDEIDIICPQIDLDSVKVNETCYGDNDGQITLTPSNGTAPYNYNWSDGQISNPAINLAGGTYQVTITDAGGCEKKEDFTIAPGLIPPDVFIIFREKLCVSEPADTMAASYPFGVWSGNGVVVNGNTATFDPGIAGVGIHTVTYTIGGVCGASGTLDIEVIDMEIDQIIIDHISCFGYSDGSAEFELSQPVDSILFFIQPDSIMQTQNIIQNLPIGSYSIVGVWIDSLYCTLDSTIQITEPLQLVPNFNFVDATCFNVNNGNIIANPIGGIAPHSYNWSTGAITQNIINLSPGVYYLTITDANNCSADTVITISAPPGFVFSFSSDSANCNNPDGQAQVFNVSGATAPYTFLWDVNAANQANDTAYNLIPGTYQITITDNLGCDSVHSIIVPNKAGPTLNISKTDNTCFNACDGSATAIANGGTTPGNYSYLWSNGANTDIANLLCAGTYDVTATDGNGCTASGTITILEPDQLIAYVNSDTIICVGGTVSLNATASGGTTPYNFIWDNGWNTAGPNTDNPVGNTCYTVYATDANNCQSANVISCVTFYPALVANAFSDQTICEGDEVTLTASASGGNPNNTYSYNWDGGNSLSSTYQLIPTGTYPNQVIYVVTVSDGCSPDATAMVTISFFEPKNPTITPELTEICPGEQVNFVNASLYPFQNCIWNYGDGNTTLGCFPVPNYIYYNPGTYTVQLSGYTDDGCFGTTTSTVVVFEPPVADFIISPNPTTIRDMKFKFFDKSLGNIVSWNWEFMDNDLNTQLGQSTEQNPIFDFYNSLHGSAHEQFLLEDTGRYPVYLQIVSEEGCISDTMFYAFVKPVTLFFIPNTFTPNEDKRNELFYPVFFGIISDFYEFSIYDRWGELLFKSTDIKSAWDGTAPELGFNEILKQDVYVWKLKFTDIYGEEFEYRGNVNLIR